MQSDPEFGRHWLSSIKELFDIEDADGNLILDREEFDRFYRQLKSAMVSEDRLEDELTYNKIQIAWIAINSISQQADGISWTDFMRSEQIL